MYFENCVKLSPICKLDEKSYSGGMKNKNSKSKFLYIFGKNPIEEILETRPELVLRVYAKDTVNDIETAELLPFLRKHKISFMKVPEKKLKQLVGEVSHQGFVAEIKEFPMLELYDFLEGLDMESNPSVLVLDEIQDPHNYGAILRTAAASGVSAVIVGKNNQATITGTVFKTSAGALTKVPVVQVANISTTLERLKKEGFWTAGLAMEGDQLYWKQDLTGPMAFVVGNEGRGMRDLTKKTCDYLLSIPMQEGVESLNASVSAAVLLYEWRRQAELDS